MKNLFLFLSLCLLLVACSPPREVEVASNPLTSPEAPYPIETPTQQAYIITMPTPLPPTDTPSVPPTVRPTPTNTPTPTTTPIPTPVPLPDSGSAIWVETYSFDNALPDGITSRSTIYEADPRDMASRQLLLEIPDIQVYKASLSPSGDQIALLTLAGDPYQGHKLELWLYQIGEALPQQISPLAFDMMWKPTGQQLAYTTFVNGNLSVQKYDTANHQSSLLFEGSSLTEQIQPLVWGADDTAYFFVITNNADGSVSNHEELIQITINNRSIESLASYDNATFNSLTPIDNDSSLVHIAMRQNGDSQRIVFNLANGTEISLSEAYSHVEWLTSGTFLGIRNRFAYIYDVTVQSEIQEYELAHSVWGVGSAAPDGEWVYIEFANQGWQLWHLASDSFVPLPQGKHTSIVMAGWR